MRKSAVAVIHMLQSSNEIKLLFPDAINWDTWRESKSDFPFSFEVIEYLNALSKSLLKDKNSRVYPDVITFAFFCRKANLLIQREKYVSSDIRLGRGILFHIAPSNVPINFAYSLVAGLLSGNNNIVRVSTKDFPQVDLVVSHIKMLSNDEKFFSISKRIALVRYDRSSTATTFFSSFCNVRIIWGGDNTILQIRKSTLPPRSFDVTFADRYSLAVINADELIKAPDITKIATGFYNDTYLFDQNACSAPHLVVWLGDKFNIKTGKSVFWKAIQNEIRKKYEFQSVLAVDKLTAIYKQASSMEIQQNEHNDNTLIRVQLNYLSKEIDNFRCAGGYFSEFDANSINEIAPIVKNNYQTLAYYGVEKNILENFVKDNLIIGIDRIVPIGNTTDFALTWDGYNLINTLTRECAIL